MARPEVARELGDHIEDQTRAFMSEGMSRQEAEKAAVKEMGNPVETGVELDKIHCPKMPWGMITLIIVLSVLSVFSVSSESGIDKCRRRRLFYGKADSLYFGWDFCNDRSMFC